MRFVQIPTYALWSIVFGTNFGARQKGWRNSLSLRERARVRESNQEYLSFFPSS